MGGGILALEKIAFTLLKRKYELHKEEYDAAVCRVLNRGWYILGHELSDFESAFAKYLDVSYCVGLNSGTDALILAIRALGIGAGDEVILPAGAYIASVIGVTENRATPVFVDSDDHLLMDVNQIESKITEKTKAILPVHMYGQSCDMEKIMQLADRHKLYVIEDCAQSHGACVKGKKTGTFGDIGCFSFYPTKPLGAFGDAGAVVTDHEELFERIVMLRNYGSKVKYHNEIQGVNSRMDEIQAAALCVGLKYLEEENIIRREIGDYYLRHIKNKKLVMPVKKKMEENVFHIFPVLTERREDFMEYLKENKVESQIHYPIPPYRAKCYSGKEYGQMGFYRAEYAASHEVSLPIYVGLKRDEMEYITQVCNQY